ncbi:MAG: ATP-dependent metallopeptidase FtsH/Yme1/Tma family protein [Bacilli bacterium]|nr:ATP-dependent metallopeptidase FtsH/Yme1/Tma family protein [Bacilli bacterium]
MKERHENQDKSPKRSFFYYYGIVLLVVFLLNTFLVPLMAGRSVKEVSYDQFLHYIKEKQVDMVYQNDEGLMFTLKDGTEKEWGNERTSFFFPWIL